MCGMKVRRLTAVTGTLVFKDALVLLWSVAQNETKAN
jgi:hypothetical protein